MVNCILRTGHTGVQGRHLPPGDPDSWSAQGAYKAFCLSNLSGIHLNILKEPLHCFSWSFGLTGLTWRVLLGGISVTSCGALGASLAGMPRGLAVDAGSSPGAAHRSRLPSPCGMGFSQHGSWVLTGIPSISRGSCRPLHVCVEKSQHATCPASWWLAQA